MPWKCRRASALRYPTSTHAGRNTARKSGVHAAWLVLAMPLFAAAAVSPRPSFVIMLADDLGWGDWSRTGAPAHTPNLEAMSRSQHAVWFHRAYSGNPICAPTRASLLTGRTPARSCIHDVEQHVLCRETPAGTKGGCSQGEYTLANASRDAGANYLSGFYGKWHLGSLSNESGRDCYQVDGGTRCLEGYMRFGSDTTGGIASCCMGIDALSWPGNAHFTNTGIGIAHPLHFGFDEFTATPQCGASSNTNCGCFFYPKAWNSTPCNLGHYSTKQSHKKYPNSLFTECSQYYNGESPGHVWPMDTVSPIDDEAFLVDKFESLLQRSVAEQRPFLAVLFFHGVHIPYIATPENRAVYADMGMDENEQDYWGTVTQIDNAVGRVRQLLKEYGVANTTWVSITADNGPEVSPTGGQGTAGAFPNPGRTAGLRGRKRDCTEGGTRVIGIVEYPPAVKANRVELTYPIITMDVMATVLDILGLPSYQGRRLDGTSLLPVLKGEQSERPIDAGIGIHGSFSFGITNRPRERCPVFSDARQLGDVPEHFSTSGRGSGQFSWAEGNHLKIFGCSGFCNGTNCNESGVPYPDNRGWRFFLFNLTNDPAETTDLWSHMRPVALAMFGRFQEWQASVRRSQGEEELGCNTDPHRPGPGQPPHSCDLAPRKASALQEEYFGISAAGSAMDTQQELPDLSRSPAFVGVVDGATGLDRQEASVVVV